MNAVKGKIIPLRDNVLIADMNFDEQKTTSGIIIRSDNGKTEGIKPRWGQVWAIGPEQEDVKVGDWICVEHGRWTRGIKVENPDDYEPGTKMPKMAKKPIWLVTIVMPKKLMQEIQQGSLDLESATLDLEDIEKAYEEGEDSNVNYDQQEEQANAEQQPQF